LKNKDIRIDEILFGEAPSRIVVSLYKDKLRTLEKIVRRHSVPYQVLGNVSGKRLVVQYKEKTIIDLPLKTLSDTWRKAIPSRL